VSSENELHTLIADTLVFSKVLSTMSISVAQLGDVVAIMLGHAHKSIAIVAVIAEALI
jgi:hypothetical protein